MAYTSLELERKRQIRDIPYKLQWYISKELRNDLKEYANVIFDTEKYNSGDNSTIRDLVRVFQNQHAMLNTDCIHQPSFANQIIQSGFQTFLLVCRARDNEIIHGFAEINFGTKTPNAPAVDRNNVYLYIDLLCGSREYRGVGQLLINEIKQFCRHHGISEIRLGATGDSKGFYEHEGFQRKNPENPLEFSFFVEPQEPVGLSMGLSGGKKFFGRKKNTKNHKKKHANKTRRLKRTRQQKSLRIGI